MVESFDHIGNRHPAAVTDTNQCFAEIVTLVGMHANSGSILLGEGRSQIFMFRLIVEHSQPFFSIQFQELEFRVPRGFGRLW